jgi:hypothetical protein
MPTQLEQSGDEQLIAVRRAVLSDVEHAVGNLLQRMHHAARAAKAGLGAHGERLHTALDDLEHLLELLFDYVSPVDVQIRPTSAGRIAESFAAHLRAQGLADVTCGAGAGMEVLADPQVLGRSLGLLAQACARECEAAGPLAIEVVYDAAGERVQFSVQSAAGLGAATPHSSLAAAVAGRLIELQGGEVQARPRPACVWVVALPAANGGA